MSSYREGGLTAAGYVDLLGRDVVKDIASLNKAIGIGAQVLHVRFNCRVSKWLYSHIKRG